MGIPAQPAIVSSLMLKARSGLSGDHMGMVEFDAANGPVLKYQELELDPSGNGVDEYIRKGDFE
jgi:hypothetical protein